MIKLENITKTYKRNFKKFNAVEDINLDLESKGLIFLLGPSGSGKTTLLDLINKIIKPTSGTIDYNTDIDTNLKNFRTSNIAYIYQEYNLLEYLTVRENLQIALNLEKKEYNEEEIKETLNKLKLKEDILNAYPAELSGGEQQRVAIIRALLIDTKIILADEPSGALDKENTKILFDILKEISKDKLIVCVTHLKEIAKRYGDRIIEIKQGQIQSDETKKELSKEKVNYDLNKGKADLKLLTKLGVRYFKPLSLVNLLSTIVYMFLFAIFFIFIFFLLKDDSIMYNESFIQIKSDDLVVINKDVHVESGRPADDETYRYYKYNEQEKAVIDKYYKNQMLNPYIDTSREEFEEIDLLPKNHRYLFVFTKNKEIKEEDYNGEGGALKFLDQKYLIPSSRFNYLKNELYFTNEEVLKELNIEILKGRFPKENEFLITDETLNEIKERYPEIKTEEDVFNYYFYTYHNINLKNNTYFKTAKRCVGIYKAKDIDVKVKYNLIKAISKDSIICNEADKTQTVDALFPILYQERIITKDEKYDIYNNYKREMQKLIQDIKTKDKARLAKFGINDLTNNAESDFIFSYNNAKSYEDGIKKLVTYPFIGVTIIGVVSMCYLIHYGYSKHKNDLKVLNRIGFSYGDCFYAFSINKFLTLTVGLILAIPCYFILKPYFELNPTQMKDLYQFRFIRFNWINFLISILTLYGFNLGANAIGTLFSKRYR